MKRFLVLLIGLAFIVAPVSVGLADYPWKSLNRTAEQTADAAAVTGAGHFGGIIIATDGSNDVTVDIYDNTAASGNNIIPTVVCKGSSRIHAIGIDPPTPFFTGVYVDITCAGTLSYIVYYTTGD